jgi:hypothetical protein
MKKLSIILVFMLLITGCTGNHKTEPETQPVENTENNDTAKQEQKDTVMQMRINDTLVTVQWEDNESVKALKSLLSEGPLTISLSMYGGFEQVGSLGTSLPRNDIQITTESGDIVLYSGNQIVVFYGSNSWSYTRLGHITDKDSREMKDLLGNGNVTIVLSLN